MYMYMYRYLYVHMYLRNDNMFLYMLLGDFEQRGHRRCDQRIGHLQSFFDQALGAMVSPQLGSNSSYPGADSKIFKVQEGSDQEKIVNHGRWATHKYQHIFPDVFGQCPWAQIERLN